MASSQPASGDEQNEVPKNGKKQKRKQTADSAEIFCYCREPEGNRFMIGCDACNEWYHGDCIQISRTKGKEIDIYYCPSCISENGNLQIVYFSKKNEEDSLPVRCTECLPCVKQPDCGECSRCRSKKGRCVKVFCISYPETNSRETIAKKKDSDKKQHRKSHHRKASIDDEDERDETFIPTEASTSRKSGGGGVAMANRKKPPRGAKKRTGKRDVKKEVEDEYVPPPRPGYDTALVERMVKGSKEYVEWQEKMNGQKKGRAPPIDGFQCLGPGCILEARPKSKYCSDACGMALAKSRISAHLPRGLDNYWKAKPIAVRQAEEEEAAREKELAEMKVEKENLDRWHKMVIDYVNSMKVIKKIEDAEEDRGGETDVVMACPVCAVEYGSRSLQKHIEKCFAKTEKQATFGTGAKYPINPHNIFCEAENKPNPSNNAGVSYCKRIRVNCPEHYKGDIEEGLQICGWPSFWSSAGSKTMEQLLNSFEELIKDGQCCVSRKECKQHVGWITMMLGQIDARRIAYFHRMDEMCEANKKVKRGDALLLMSNHTEYHQPLEKIIKDYDNGADAGGETMMSTLL